MFNKQNFSRELSKNVFRFEEHLKLNGQKGFFAENSSSHFEELFWFFIEPLRSSSSKVDKKFFNLLENSFC